MPKCKKSDGRAIDYAYKLLPPTEAELFEVHLQGCTDCADAVESFTAVLALTDAAQEDLAMRDHALQQIEMNVYKRLAATQEQPSPSRLRVCLRTIDSLFSGSTIAAAASIAIVLITAAVLIGNPFQPDGPLQLTATPSADARIEQYRQQGIQRNLEEALITHYLRNDAWETESQLHRMKEQAQGTNWTKIADKHLQDLQFSTLSLNSTAKGY